MRYSKIISKLILSTLVIVKFTFFLIMGNPNSSTFKFSEKIGLIIGKGIRYIVVVKRNLIY